MQWLEIEIEIPNALKIAPWGKVGLRPDWGVVGSDRPDRAWGVGFMAPVLVNPEGVRKLPDFKLSEHIPVSYKIEEGNQRTPSVVSIVLMYDRAFHYHVVRCVASALASPHALARSRESNLCTLLNSACRSALPLSTACPSLLTPPLQISHDVYTTQWNSYGVLCGIGTVCISIWSLPVAEFGVRLSLDITLLLVAVAFKQVLSSELPPVSYLTILDRCASHRALSSTRSNHTRSHHSYERSQHRSLFELTDVCHMNGCLGHE